MLMGHWKNFEELEDSLSLEEIQVLLDAQRKAEFQKQKFAAALKGVDLPDPEAQDVPTFEDVKRRAEARIRGISEEQQAFMDVGIYIEEDDDELPAKPEVVLDIPEMLIEEE